MVDYSEEEKIEQIRQWWAENGVGVIIAIVMAVAALIGWRQWQTHQAGQAAAASTLYQTMQDNLQMKTDAARTRSDSETEDDVVKGTANQLLEEFPSSVYADYASLVLARLAVEEGEYEQASAHVQAVLDDPASETLRWVATLRMARLKVQLDDVAAAEALVSVDVPEAFSGQAFEIKGDILRFRADIEGAREAYAQALKTTESEAHRELVRMKLDDLAPAS